MSEMAKRVVARYLEHKIAADDSKVIDTKAVIHLRDYLKIMIRRVDLPWKDVEKDFPELVIVTESLEDKLPLTKKDVADARKDFDRLLKEHKMPSDKANDFRRRLDVLEKEFS